MVKVGQFFDQDVFILGALYSQRRTFESTSPEQKEKLGKCFSLPLIIRMNSLEGNSSFLAPRSQIPKTPTLTTDDIYPIVFLVDIAQDGFMSSRLEVKILNIPNTKYI
jgi:hypothetical protein